MQFSIRTIKTGVVLPPQDNLLKHIRQLKLSLKEGDIVVVTSKVVGIWEGRTLPLDSISKDELIKKEARMWIPREHVSGARIIHTITQGVLIPSAGIDESNGNGWYILLPKDSYKSARRLLKFLKKEYKIEKLGIIITDSRSNPLRRGLTGFALSYAGFPSLVDYRGDKDIFGRRFYVSQANIPDALAAAAVLAMGEGNEQTPIAVVSGTQYVYKKESRKKLPFKNFDVTLGEDLFGVFLKNAPWKKGRGK